MIVFWTNAKSAVGMGIVKVLTVLLLLPIPLIDPVLQRYSYRYFFYTYIYIYIYIYDRLGAELTLLYILKCKINI